MTRITRSARATSAPTAERVARLRIALPNGWWGMALFVTTEAGIFGSLIAAYFYLRVQSGAWPPDGIAAPDVLPPLLLTALLVATAFGVAAASRRARAGRARAAAAIIAATLLAQAGYAIAQATLFADDLHRFSPRDSAYGSAYFTLLGVHHAHVAIGMLLSLAVLVRISGGLTNYRVIGVRTLALYWGFVAVAGVFVVFTQISPAR
jgi:heme/copper-type cytochrome/quinol oxidase subunit 3